MVNIYKVLIIEDDINMAELMKKLLEKWGVNATICEDFENVINTFKKVEPHIILMDINISTYDGFYWCKKIREISSVPVIFVSSRDSSMDIVMAVNNGGDDYIQKPFDSSVLIAKLQAIIRRTYEYRANEAQIMECSNVVLSIKDATVHYKDKSSELTRNEFKILQTLMDNKGKLVSRESLMKQLWNDDIYVNENTLTVNINRLRKRLEDIGVNDFINTKKGMGYIII